MAANKKLNRKVRNSYLISTLSTALVLFLLGSVGYLMFTAMDVAKSLRESIVATVELRNGVSEVQREQIREQIAAYHIAGEVRFSSKREKIENEEFREMFGIEFEQILEDNPLMDSFEVSLAADVENREEMDRFSQEVEQIRGVARVSYPALLVEQVHSTVNKFQMVILLFGGALLFISMVLLNNTIRLAIYSRRAIINTMKLVGATKWFIIRPFLWSGMWSGFWAGVLASLLLALSVYGLGESLQGLVSLTEIERAGYIMLVMTGGGIIISLFFTWISVSSFVNMKSNKIHLY